MPTTIEQRERSLHQPAFCELLPVRDILHDVIVRTTGAFVAGYELSGINSYYHNDEGRNRTKVALEALIRSLPERSMRMQARFEITEGLGDLLDNYKKQLRSENPTLLALDRARVEAWKEREKEGFYLRPLLHAYFHWNPVVHHELPGAGLGNITKRLSRDGFSLSANKCIQRTRREHEDLLSEFASILSGVEQTLKATGMMVRRLSDVEIFLELKRALNPLLRDPIPLRRPESSLRYQSARDQVVNTNIEHEEETYIRVGGLLHSFVTLKDLPDATFPGILRDLVGLDFPITVNTEVTIPDQAAMIKHYKSRLKKMQAAQRDSHGNVRIDVDAQVAQRQLMETLEQLISSSLKTCRTSMVIGVRTSQPVQSHRDLAEQERVLADRRHKVLYTVMQMNGSRGLQEDLAKRRLFIGGLPGMGEENQRENDCLTLHAADLLPVETSWRGMPQAPLILLETPHRQLVPFSPWDASLADANLLIMAASGGGKTFMAMLFLLMMARIKPLISILERGDSYRPLVELMGGRCIDVDLEGSVTLNPWDLPPGSGTPGKDKIAFLKNLTRHMIGDSPNSDTALLDNLLSEAISRTYKRCAIRHSNPIPTFNDLREELQQWRDEERIERTVEEAKLAALKLREWTGEKGVYSKLFDQHTTLKTDADWLFFNVERLSDDPRLETAMSMMIAHAMQERASGRTGQHSITVLDECWSLLDSNVLAPEVVQLFRTARKRGGSVWGISQTLEDFVGTDTQPRIHGPGIVRNVSTKIIGRQPGDVAPLATHLALNQVALNEIKQLSAPRKGRSADVLLVIGEKAETTQIVRLVPTRIEYWVCTTFPRERTYRKYFFERNRNKPLLEIYEELAQKFPNGLAEVPPLPEEVSGAVSLVKADGVLV
jgi:type IV secretion system protein TrbE